jgi:hypothetical protein
MRRVIELGEWHAEWSAKWAAEFHPDHHLRDALLEAPPEARREFFERADRILGLGRGPQRGQDSVEDLDGARLV